MIDSPAGSNWTLQNDSFQDAIFQAFTTGQYLVSLIVDDGFGTSAPDIIAISVADNLPPVAIATADKTNGPAPLMVRFDGSQSYDPEGGPLSYDWDLNDGSNSTNATFCHTYTRAGSYIVAFGAGDQCGAWNFKVFAITVVPAAVMRVALTSTNTLMLAWPAALTGYDLEQNANLATTNWLAVTNAPETMGDEKQVILPPAPGQNFYRLHKP